MSASISYSKRIHSSLLPVGEDYEDYPVQSGKRVRYTSSTESSINFIFSPPIISSRHSGITKSSPLKLSSPRHNSFGEEVEEQEQEEENHNMSRTSRNTPSKKYIDEYFEFDKLNHPPCSLTPSEGMEIPMAVCGACTACLGEDDVMEDTLCYFCSKRGCKYCVTTCTVCNDRFCSKCSMDVYSYSCSDERICIDCNCENRTR
jgi:hypothetical protein